MKISVSTLWLLGFGREWDQQKTYVFLALFGRRIVLRIGDFGRFPQNSNDMPWIHDRTGIPPRATAMTALYDVDVSDR